MNTQTGKQSSLKTPAGRGFSLLELLIVLAVLALAVGLSWPALQKPMHKSRLRSAAKMLQSELGRARTKAIESGSVLRFRYQPNTPRFMVRAAMIISAAADDPTVDEIDRCDIDAEELEESEIEQLPDGVYFCDIEPARSQWSKPINFYPNGRVTGGRFRLVGRHGYYVDVTLRGLTAAAKIGKVLRREDDRGQMPKKQPLAASHGR